MSLSLEAPPVQGQLPGQQVAPRCSKVDEDGHEQVVPGCFSRNFMRCPCCVMWGTFIAALFLGAVPILTGRITPKLGFAVMLYTDTVSEQVDFYLWRQVSDQYKDDQYKAPSQVSSGSPDPYAEGMDLPLSFYYEGLNSDSNMFTADAIASVATYERALLEMDSWATHCKNATSTTSGETRCASPQTVLRFLHTNAALEQQQCEDGYCFSQQPFSCSSSDYGTYPCMSTVYDWRDGTLAPESQWPSLLAQVCTNAAFRYTKTVLFQTAAECTATALSSRYVRSLYKVYSPYNESETLEDRGFADLNEDFVKDLAAVLDETKDKVSATTIYDSKVATGGKPVNVWWSGIWTDHLSTLTGVLIMQDMSLAIASIALVFVILVLNTGSLLLSLAGLFEIIISILLAMFCWMLLGQDQVTALELMGIFLILCVGADDIFVFTDTWKESAVMPHAISGTLLTRFSWTYRRAAGAMLTTTATTAISLMLSGFSVFPMVQAFGLFNMFIVICDYLLVITWFAATTVCLERLANKACPPGGNWEFSCCCPGDRQAQKKERRATAWFRDTLPPALYKARWVLIALSMAALVGGVACCATLFEDGELANIPTDHPGFVGIGGKIDLIASDDFGDADETKLRSYLFYGMADPPVTYPKSIDIYQSQKDDYFDRFTLNFDANRFGPAQQQLMVADCEALSSQAEIVVDAERHCLLAELKAHVGGAFPYADEASLRAALEAFYASARYTELKDLYEDYADYTGFLAGDERGIKALWHSFNTTMPTTTPAMASARQKYYDPWRAAVDAQCSDSAPCVMTVPQFFSYMGVANTLQRAAILNIGLALVVAYFILLIFTGNFIVPILAILSIGSTITWVLASILIVGYKFDVVASILIVMIVGMSVDYAAHLVHFYNEMGGTRYAKVQGALHGVGISVIGGALTTAGAAAPLLFTRHFTFFKEMGFFIFFTALFGIFFSFLQLVPILMVCGPEGKTGDVRHLAARAWATLGPRK